MDEKAKRQGFTKENMAEVKAADAYLAKFQKHPFTARTIKPTALEISERWRWGRAPSLKTPVTELHPNDLFVRYPKPVDARSETSATGGVACQWAHTKDHQFFIRFTLHKRIKPNDDYPTQDLYYYIGEKEPCRIAATQSIDVDVIASVPDPGREG